MLGGIAQGREAIDEDRMSTIIKRQILSIHNQVSQAEAIEEDYVEYAHYL